MQAETCDTRHPGRELAGDATLVMGIVNVTPDSFSDGGNYFDARRAIEHAWRLIDEGVDILDIGAESTRPTSTAVPFEEEWARLEPVLQELCKSSPVPVSVDTYKAKTAAKALECGVQIVNDVWGGLADADMLPLVASAGCEYIWMHNRHKPAVKNPFETLIRETRAGIARCLEAGIHKERLWIDPGIGFGKTAAHNLTIMKHLAAYCELGYPVLLGTSRKRFIGAVVGGEPAERLEGTLATVCAGVIAGVRAVRVHDVLPTVKACRMMDAIVHASDA